MHSVIFSHVLWILEMNDPLRLKGHICNRHKLQNWAAGPCVCLWTSEHEAISLLLLSALPVCFIASHQYCSRTKVSKIKKKKQRSRKFSLMCSLVCLPACLSNIQRRSESKKCDGNLKILIIWGGFNHQAHQSWQPGMLTEFINHSDRSEDPDKNETLKADEEYQVFISLNTSEGFCSGKVDGAEPLHHPGVGHQYNIKPDESSQFGRRHHCHCWWRIHRWRCKETPLHRRCRGRLAVKDHQLMTVVETGRRHARLSSQTLSERENL